MFASLKSKIKEETGSDLSKLTSSWRTGAFLGRLSLRDDSSISSPSSSAGPGDTTSDSISPQLESYLTERTGGQVDQVGLHQQYSIQLEEKLRERDIYWQQKIDELKLSLSSAQVPNMDSKRSKNFTEREKMLLIEVAKEFVAIIDNKKTDGTTVEAKKRAWMALTRKYNAVSETGIRTEKQLHALYDNLKKKARKNMSDDKSEMYKTGGGTFCPKMTIVDEKVVAPPQFKPLENEFDSSAPYYNLNKEKTSTDTQNPIEEHNDPLQDGMIVYEEVEMENLQSDEKSIDVDESTPKIIKKTLTETKKKNINNISASIIKRKNQKQLNEDSITKKKLEILEIQRKQELHKLKKNNKILNLEIELKKTLLESAKMDLEIKKNKSNL